MIKLIEIMKNELNNNFRLSINILKTTFSDSINYINENK